MNRSFETPRSPTPLKDHFHIRWMIRRDMPEVLQIERDSFPYPWDEPLFLKTLRDRNCIGMVAEKGEKIVGYMLYQLHKSYLEVVNFAVHPDWRRKTVGTQMVNKLLSKLSSHRRVAITLDVRETNLDAQLFFRKQGFLAAQIRHNHFEDGRHIEDGYCFEYVLPDEEDDWSRKAEEVESQDDGTENKEAA